VVARSASIEITRVSRANTFIDAVYDVGRRCILLGVDFGEQGRS